MPYSTQLIVLGSTSFLGKSIPEQLLREYDEVISYSSSNCDLASESSTLSASQSWKSGCHILFFSVINKPIDNSEFAYEKNLSFARNVAKAANSCKADAVLFSSSVDVYGNSPNLPIDEDSRLEPDSWYARAKAESETLLSKELHPRCSLGIFRCGGMYDLTVGDISVVGKFYKTAKSGGLIALHNQGRNLRDFSLASDIIVLFRYWLRSPRTGIWNAISGTSLTMADIAEIIVNEVGAGSISKLGGDQRDFDIAFDARSLIKTYGQNPIRPANLSLPIQIKKQQPQN